MPSFRNASKSYSMRGLSGVSKSVWSIPKWLSYFLSYEICFIRTLCLLSKSLRKVVLGAHKLCRHSAMRRNPILCAVSPVSQNLYGQSLNDFHIFLAMKYASFGHSAYCRNHYGRLSHLREKYGKSPPKILSIFTPRQHNFSPNVFFGSFNSA